MKKIFSVAFLVAMSGAFFAPSASAALTYLDATRGGNTFNTGSTSNFSSILATAVNTDNLWGQRAFGTGGTIFESTGSSGTENSPEINTIISGLTSGVAYDVWVHFIDPSVDTNQEWTIRAGFTSGSLVAFDGPDAGAGAGTVNANANNAVLANTLTYTTGPDLSVTSGRTMMAGFIGSLVANGSGEIVVYIDDLPSTIGANNRSWYDGVSYEVSAIPEPSSLAAICLVGFGLASARRRRS